LIRVVGIQNCELETFGAYAVTLSSMPEIELDIVHAYRGEELPAAEDCDFVLVGGTPISAWNASRHEFLALELDFLRELIVQQIPALGICCGAQMLAMLLGAEVSRAETMEVGAYSAQRADTGADDPALAGFPDEFPVYHWHGDTFGVPTGGTLLATGIRCSAWVLSLACSSIWKPNPTSGRPGPPLTALISKRRGPLLRLPFVKILSARWNDSNWPAASLPTSWSPARVWV